ncbi:MAG: hypothetical protein ACXAEN_23445, partial [Candidatus Thorarchaeota archaeon]
TRGQATQAEEAGLLDRERRLHPEKFRAAGSQTREPHPLIPQGVPIGEAVRALMTTASKAAGDYRREKIGSLKADMARNRLESLHETDKGGGLKWNKNDPEDLKAMIGTVSDEQATDMFILQELALARYSIEEIKMAYPSIIDDRLMGERDVVPSLAGEQPTRIIVGSMLGDRGITALDTLEVNTEDLTTVVNNLPDDLSDLGEDGPLQSVFFTAWDSGGLVPGGDKRQKFENYRDFVTWLRTFSEEKIRTYIGGWDAEDRALDKQTVRSRDQARMLRDAMIKKYGAHIARQLGLQGAPKRKQHTTLLGKMGEAAGGLLRGFTAEEEIE